MAKGIKRRVKKALEKVDEEIGAHASSGGLYARGLASEGYKGGYRDALSDVLLLLDGIEPSFKNRLWWR